MKAFTVITFFALLCTGLMAQEESITLQFSDPDRPGMVSASLINGGIRVIGHDSPDIVVTVPNTQRNATKSEPSPNGMRRIIGNSPNLEIEESDNKVEISVKSWSQRIDLEVLVPYETSLSLKCTNDGDIYVDNVKGDLETKNVNGAITLKNISGSVVAHTINQDLLVTFAEVDRDKPMSFSSLNGDVDVSFPANINGKFFMESNRGDIFTGFDMTLSQEVHKDESGGPGRRKLSFKSQMVGTVGNGSQEFSLKTFNGSIYIRKAEY